MNKTVKKFVFLINYHYLYRVMKRKHQEYIDRHLYEESLHRKHAAARENRVAMEHGDDDFQSELTPTKEQMYLDIIKELERKLDEAEAMRGESASQQSLDRLLEMLAAKENSIEKLTEELRLSREKSAEQIRILQEKSAAEIKSLRNELSSFRVAMERLVANKDAELQLLRNQLYGKKSQKGRRTKRSKDQDDNQDRDNFDGTSESLSQGSTSKKSEASNNTATESKLQQADEPTGRVVKKAIRPEKYNTMKAAKVKEHKCDISQLPEGYKFIRYRIVKEFTHVSYIQEDRYHIAVVKNKEGRFEEFYIPLDKSDKSMPRENVVKGTHATPEFVAYMLDNKYSLHTPINRQMHMYRNDKGEFSQQTVSNYYTKAYDQFSVLKSHLESILKSVGSFIHCDETWVRVRVKDEDRKVIVKDVESGVEKVICPTKLVKRYMWTIVNEAEKITYFLYSSGSRSREVITNFLKEFKGALQSDGYVAYKYFDSDEVDVDHIVCMAHVRAKFKDAQPTDSLANYFVDQIGKLYMIEMYNKIEGLSNNDIYRRRKTESMPILNEMKRRAEEFLKTDGGVASDKMYTAVNYMLNFWRELIRYTKEGHYTIDNSAAERSIRPLAVGRKNYIHFGSEKSAEMSAFFYSIMATCKMRGENARDYISRFFKALGAGRTDYAQMLPGLL